MALACRACYFLVARVERELESKQKAPGNSPGRGRSRQIVSVEPSAKVGMDSLPIPTHPLHMLGEGVILAISKLACSRARGST